MKKTENDKFIRYDIICGNKVAIMRGGLSEFPVNKKCLETRIKNLKRQKLPYNETLRALEGFED
jgi:hypothetical protein